MVFAGNYLHASLVTIYILTLVTLNILIFMSDTVNYEILHLGYFFFFLSGMPTHTLCFVLFFLYL